jgi:hypothetical protein
MKEIAGEMEGAGEAQNRGNGESLFPGEMLVVCRRGSVNRKGVAVDRTSVVLGGSRSLAADIHFLRLYPVLGSCGDCGPLDISSCLLESFLNLPSPVQCAMFLWS